MIGRLLNTIITILFMTYIILLISFFFLHEALKNNVNQVNYSILDTISTTGVFSEDTYEYLKTEIYKYSGGGTYKVIIKYEKKVKPGLYDTYWKKDTIGAGNLSNDSTIPDDILTLVGKPIPMHVGDKLSIYLEDQNQTLFVKLLNAPLFGAINEYSDMRIKSLKTVVIGHNAKNIVKGYELKAEIAQKNAMTDLAGVSTPYRYNFDVNGDGAVDNNDTITLRVKTETHIKNNGVGYEYNSANPTYGDDTSEQYHEEPPIPPATLPKQVIGENYIFDTVEFYRQVDYYPIPDPIPAGKDMSDYEQVIEFIQS